MNTITAQTNINDSARLPSKSSEITLVLIHGWGMNQGVWAEFIPALQQCGVNSIKCIDLPGFGNNHSVQLEQYDLAHIAAWLAPQLPKNSVVLGWSLGGLVAQYLSIYERASVIAHIQMCSTPKFAQHESWAGIKPELLDIFKQQLKTDLDALLGRFLAIQCMGLEKPKQQMKVMHDSVSAYPNPNQETLDCSLNILLEADLREDLSNSETSSLWIFGRLDSLVPSKVQKFVEEQVPKAQTLLLKKASHAPFISHKIETAQSVADFLQNLLK